MKKNLTKQHIWESFYELSESIPFERLTVERIIAYSGVSKATFYRYFRDKYDVLNYNSLAVAERLSGWRQCKNWKEFLHLMFQEIEADLEYYRRAFKSSGQNAHYCHGCVDCLEDWIRSNNRFGAQEMAQLYYEAMPLSLRDTWQVE